MSPQTPTERLEQLSHAEGSPLGEHHVLLRHFLNHVHRARRADWEIVPTDMWSMYESAVRLVDETRPQAPARFAWLERLGLGAGNHPLRIPVTTGTPRLHWSSSPPSATRAEAAR